MQPESADIEVQETRGEDGVLRLAVSGEIDASTAGEVDSAARPRVAEGPVLLDLAAVRFMDSTGVRLLDGLARHAAQHGTELRIVPTFAPIVEKVLRITGMLDHLPLVER